MKQRLVIIVLALLCLLAVGQAAGQNAVQPAAPAAGQPTTPATSPIEPVPAAPRPKIALVLEGGGALGLAHVGILRWFEQHHIPIDAVAGTSMGALVGGLYASGMSSDEVEKFIASVNWGKALRNATPYRDRAFRRKEDQRDYPNDLEFGLKSGIAFPSGFNSGHQVGLILDRVAIPYSDLKSFDDLPTPFRCVATDLVSGKSQVFDSGSLAEALRSTMSLPAIFSPVRSHDQVYVDGGLLDNLPVDVARRMKPDIVIAVHLRTRPLEPTESLSAFAVLQRSVSVVISVNELQSMRSLENADLLIQVDTEGYTSTDYQAAGKIVEAGFKAAEDRGSVLSHFALDDAAWQQYLATRQSRQRPVPVPNFIEVQGTRPVIAAGIEKNLAGNIGKPIDFDRLNEDLTQVTGLGRFARAGFEIVNRNGEPGLLVRADEKDYAPPTVNPLVAVDGIDYTNVRFSLGARITLLDIGGFGSEWRTDLIAGSEYGLDSEYYRPLRWASHIFVAPRVFAHTAPLDLYSQDNRVSTYRKRDLGAGLDFGLALDRYSELRFGYQAEHLHLGLDIGAQTLPDLAGRQSFSRLRFVSDHTDDPTVPRQGYSLQARFQFFDSNPGATEHFPLAEINAGVFQKISRQSSLFLLASGGSTLGYHGTGLPQFALGGPLRLGAYGPNEFLTNQYFLFQPGYLRRLKQLSPLLGGNVYLITAFEIAKPYDNFFTPESRLPLDGNAAILVQTFVGPVVFGGSVGDRGHRKIYLQVGRVF